MHIPDGYLSPVTCVAAFAAALPFWVVSFRRLGKQLHTRMVPLLAVFSAFSFVIMMFNLPLPGGTTGHAVGMAIAAIVLGPWAAMVSVSVALLIQALFFGDGGITTLGANCFNMAVVGSLVAHWTYSLIAGEAALTSRRRVVAAAIAGYFAINAAALLTAVEFGLQPMLFHDAAGTPLYAPYPLSIAIPAMMAGHLTFAGLAEMLVTGGLVAYLQRANPELLAFSTPRRERQPTSRRAWRAVHALGVLVVVLSVLSPLGLIAGGQAWGEWGVSDFVDPAARQEIMHASSGNPLPGNVPAGLARLAERWRAPIPDYAPAFLHGEGIGYILSALVGSGLIAIAFWLAGKVRSRHEQAE